MGRRNAIRRKVLFEGGEYGRGENVKANKEKNNESRDKWG